MPKPHDHFREHLSSDIAYSRSQMVSAILCDSEALEELDEYSELRMDFDLGQIGQKVEYIRYLVKGIAASKGNVQAELWALHNERIELAKLIEEALVKHITTYIDAQYRDVDLHALMREENLPEPA